MIQHVIGGRRLQLELHVAIILYYYNIIIIMNLYAMYSLSIGREELVCVLGGKIKGLVHPLDPPPHCMKLLTDIIVSNFYIV